MNNNVEVRLTAKTDGLKQGLDAAAQSVRQATDHMRSAITQASERVTDEFAKMRNAAHGAASVGGTIQSAKEQIISAASGMTGSLSGVTQTLSGIPGPAAAVAAGLIAIYGAMKLASSAAKTTESAMDLARVLGSSTNEAQKWRVALDDVGASQGELESAAKGLSKRLKDNEKDLNGLGLKTRDASGHLRPMTELLADGIGIVGKFAGGADRAQKAQELFGRGIDSSSKLLLINKEVLGSAKTTMEKFGLEVGANAVAAWKEYDSASDEAAAGLKGIGYTIGGIVMPVVTDLINAFNSLIPAAIAVLKGAIGSLVEAYHRLFLGVVAVWETINAMVISVAEPIRALGEAIGKALIGDFEGAKTAITGVAGTISGAWSTAMSKIEASSKQTKAKINAIWAKDSAAGEPEGKGGGERDTPDPKKETTKAEKEQSQMSVYEAELAKNIQIFEKEAQEKDTLRQYSKQKEAAFWDEVSKRAGVTAEDKARAEKKWLDIERGLRAEAFAVEMANLEQRKQAANQNYQDRIAVAEQAHQKTVAMYGAESKEAAGALGKVLEERRRHADQVQKLDDIQLQNKRNRALAVIADEQRDAQMQLELGLITKAQFLEQQAGFEMRMVEIKRQALAEQLALIDPQADPIKKAEIDAQIEQLELQHKQRMAGINDQTMLASTQNTKALIGSVESSWAGAIKGVMTGTMTMAQGIRGMFKGIVDAVIGMLAQMAAKWMIQQIAMKLFGKTMALGEVAKESAKAGAGGVASMAAAPFPLNLSAPAFGATMAAAAMSFAPVVASASGGYDIPAGVNPVTQLHQKEMVLPASIAVPLRESISNDSFGGSMDASPSSPEIHIHGGPNSVFTGRQLEEMLKQLSRRSRYV